MDESPVYTEHEVGKIIERAFTLQQADDHKASTRGLTLDELHHLGTEVGVSPAYVRRAAAEVSRLRTLEEQGFDQPTKQVQIVRWIPGRLTEDEIESVFVEMKDHLGPESWGGWWGTRGRVERSGRSYEWNNGSKRITLTDDGKGYILRVFGTQFFNGRLTEAVGLSLWGGLALGAIPAGLLGEAYGVIWAMMILILALAITFTFIPRYITGQRDRVEREVTSLADTFVQIAEQLNVPPERGATEFSTALAVR